MHQNISTSATVLQSYLKIRTPSFTQHCRTQSNRTNNNLKQAWSTTGSTTVGLRETPTIQDFSRNPHENQVCTAYSTCTYYE
jgi:hypothetical protein